MKTANHATPWCVYAIECRNGAIYIGITNNLQRRLSRHAAGAGSKFVRSWRPFRLLATIQCTGSTQARRIEYRLKRMSRDEKIAHLKGPSTQYSHSAAPSHSFACPQQEKQ